MKFMTLPRLFKLIAMIGVLCCCYPSVVALSYLCGYSRGTCLLFFVVFCIVGAIGYGVQMMLNRLQTAQKITIVQSRLCSIVGLFVVLMLTAVLLPTCLLAFRVFYLLILAAIFVLSGNLVLKHYFDVLGWTAVAASFGGNLAICLLMLKYPSASNIEQDTQLVLLFVAIACCLVTNNQGNIDYLMNRRKHDLSHLPQHIRYYNLLLLSGVFGILVLLFALRQPLAWLILRVKDLLMYVLRLLIQLFLWFISLFASNVVEDSVEAEQSVMDLGTSDSGNTYHNLIFIVILVVILFLLRKKIIGAISGLFKKIYFLIRDWLGSSKLIPHHGMQSEYYQDHIELVEGLTKSRKTGQSRRQLMRQYKQYQKLPKTAENFRAGYKLAVQWMTFLSIPVEPCDTTMEICSKANDALSGQHLTQTTTNYNEIRYGLQQCDQNDFFSLDKLLEELVNLSAKKRKN